MRIQCVRKVNYRFDLQKWYTWGGMVGVEQLRVSQEAVQEVPTQRWEALQGIRDPGIEATKPSLRIPLSKLDEYVDRLAEALTAVGKPVPVPRSQEDTDVVRHFPPHPQEAEAQGPLTEEEERGLVARAITKDQEAFGVLYEAKVDRVYRHIYYRVGNPHDAEDLTAQVFENAWKAIDRYRNMGRPFVVWLLSIANNQVVDHYRAKDRKKQVYLDDSSLSVSDGVDPEAIAQQGAEIEELRRAFSQLKPDQQKVLTLLFVDGLDSVDIAAIMKKSDGNVRIILHRTIKALRKILGVEASAGVPFSNRSSLSEFAERTGRSNFTHKHRLIIREILVRRGASFDSRGFSFESKEEAEQTYQEIVRAVGMLSVYSARYREGSIRANKRRTALKQQVPVEVFPGNKELQAAIV